MLHELYDALYEHRRHNVTNARNPTYNMMGRNVTNTTQIPQMTARNSTQVYKSVLVPQNITRARVCYKCYKYYKGYKIQNNATKCYKRDPMYQSRAGQDRAEHSRAELWHVRWHLRTRATKSYKCNISYITIDNRNAT